MKAPTVMLFSSCSRMTRPGDFGPVIHLCRSVLTCSTVEPPAEPTLQSSVLQNPTINWSVRYGSRVDSLLVPDDGGETEDLLSNSADALVGVTHRGAPVLGDPAARRVVNDLHCPAELADHLEVVHRRHVRVCPCVNGNITCGSNNQSRLQKAITTTYSGGPRTPP